MASSNSFITSFKGSKIPSLITSTYSPGTKRDENIVNSIHNGKNRKFFFFFFYFFNLRNKPLAGSYPTSGLSCSSSFSATAEQR